MHGYYYPMMYFDSTYWFVLIGIVITLAASSRVKSTYAKYSKIRSRSGLTGAETAQKILRASGIYDVRIEKTSGQLTDHYDPRRKILCLSDAVYEGYNIAAIGVAAHECGHAIQDQKEYIPLKFRGFLVPVANFGSMLSWPIIIAGLVFGGLQNLIFIGILLFSLAVLFQIVTLPVEFNASNRAVQMLAQTGILYEDELNKTKKVLHAAALTYVASAAAAVLQLLRLIILFGGRNRD